MTEAQEHKIDMLTIKLTQMEERLEDFDKYKNMVQSHEDLLNKGRGASWAIASLFGIISILLWEGLKHSVESIFR